MPGYPRYVSFAQLYYLMTGQVWGGGEICCETCGACYPAPSGYFWLYSGFSTDPVRYSNGEVKVTTHDLSSKGFGLPWGHTRSYSNQLTEQQGGFNGNSWRVAEWPYISQASPTSVCLVAGSIYEPVWFDLVNGSYVPRFPTPAMLVYDKVGKHYIYTDGKGYAIKLFDYSPNTLPAMQGQFKSLTDLSGRETFPSYDTKTGRMLNFIRRDKEQMLGYIYTYYADGDNIGQLQYVTQVVNNVEVRRCYYTYYGANEKYGNLNDLKKATIQQLTGGKWDNLEIAYYRYYKPGEVQGIPHGLRYMIGPQTYKQMLAMGLDPETASNAEISARADNAFQYDPKTQATVHEKTMGGKQRFRFVRTSSGFEDGFNNWAVKTVEILPDGNQNVVYTNYVGQPILSIRKAGQEEWFNYNQFDDKGLVVLTATSAAVQGYDEKSPVLVTLKPNEGFVNRYVYYSRTDIKSGAVANFLRYKQVQQGGAGQPILLNEYQYTSRTSGSTTIYLTAKEICYPNADDPAVQIQCTIYAYTWQGNTLQMAQKTTILPVVEANQNGSGLADSSKEAYDTYGNVTWQMDERGFLSNQTFDLPTGAVVQRIQDVNTSVVQGVPAGWTTPPGGGLNLVTDYTVDGLGRVTQELGPLHNIDVNGINTSLRRAKWTVYQDVQYQQWQGAGYGVPSVGGYDYTLINPVQLTFNDPSQRPVSIVTAVRANTQGKLSPNDLFPQSSWTAWTRQTYAGKSNLARKMVYFSIPPEGNGERVINYNQSRHFYDSMQNLVREQGPEGTITRLVYNPMGWITQRWVGTNDSGAMDGDPSGGALGPKMGNNMVQVEGNEYDHGQAGGDGNLTKQTKFVDAQTSRVTGYKYDFRNRQTEIDGEIDFCQVNVYDNSDHVIRADQYDTTTDGKLISRKATRYDSRGRVYQTLQYGVDPATGQIGPALTNNIWYDPSGNIIQANKAGSDLLQKTAHDGVNRGIAQYQCINVGQSGYPYPVDMSQDTVFQQQEMVYDNASNVIQQTIRERFHNATGLGALTNPTGTQPQARVNYVATWPDPLGRPRNGGNYGTNQGMALLRPAVAPVRSDAVLVTTTDYNDAGMTYQVTDPQGVAKRSAFDAAGRLTQFLENYVQGGTQSDQNKETDYTYSADSQIATLTAKNSVTGDQVTRYLYGTTLDTSDVASNALLRSIVYPDDTPTKPDRVTMGYNRQNQLTRKQDQMGTVHAIGYDLLGRQTADRITTLGAGVDGAVRCIARTYEVRGMLQTITSYDSPDADGKVINDVLMQYDQFMQLTGQFQSHDGLATPNSPAVQYVYADGSDNTVRPTGMVYPSGQKLSFDYGATGQADDLLSRVGALVDDDGSTQLAAYTYVGLNRVAQVNSPQPGTMRTYIQQGPNNPPVGTGGDQYTGWDQFNRVVDQRWLNTAGTDLERCQFGYNTGNNKLWRKNVVAGTGQDEYYTYDGLSQLLTFQRGTLNAAKSGFTGKVAWAEDFTFDPIGNWQNYVNQVNGQMTLDQNRTHNPANEIMTIGGSSTLIGQDAAGNMNKTPKPGDWSSAYTLAYDAWNRLVQVKSGSKLVAAYAYDGQNWRVRSSDGVSARHFYYSSRWQVVEERVDAMVTADRQFVWGVLGGVDNLILRDRPGSKERLYAFSDYVSVTAVVDVVGTVLERYGYNAFGTACFMTADFTPQSLSRYAWETLYDSYRWDENTGLYQVRNRYSHPNLGRWLTRDPIGERGGLNLYAQVLNNTVNRIDLLGLKPSSQCQLTNGGTLVWLSFDGSYLNGANGLYVSAVSGMPTNTTTTNSWVQGNEYWYTQEVTFDYSVARQGIVNVGPIPAGDYYIANCEERCASTSFYSHVIRSSAWGDYSWSLHPEPGTQMYGRSGFFIHGGNRWGSAGCIDLKGGDAQLHSLLQGVGNSECCYIPVTVAYIAQYVVKTENILRYIDL